MKSRLLFLSAVIFITTLSHSSLKAQQARISYKLNVYAGAGMSVMNSDNRARQYTSTIGFIHGNGNGLNLNLGGIYQFSSRIGMQVNLERNKFHGTQDRGEFAHGSSFEFDSRVYSGSVSAIYNLAPSRTVAAFYRQTRQVSGIVMLPYLKAGFGMLHYSASSGPTNDGQVQPENLSGITALIPLSGGLRFKYSNNLSFAPELTWNIPTADKLDNVDANNDQWDKFGTASFKIIYTLPSQL